MANKIHYGITNVYYSVVTETLAGGVWSESYATPVRLPGAVSITLPVANEEVRFPADNDANYYFTNISSGYSGGTLELRTLDDTFRTAVFGEQLDDNSILYESVDDKPKYIALLFQFEGDETAARHVLYRVAVGKPELASETKSTTIPEVTISLPITASGRLSDGAVKAKADETANKAKYDIWFNAVYVPVNA